MRCKRHPATEPLACWRGLPPRCGDHPLGGDRTCARDVVPSYRIGLRRPIGNVGPADGNTGALRSRLSALYVALFGEAEAPDFIALDALAFETTNILIMIGRADLSGIHQDFRNRIDRHVAHPRGRPHRTALAKHAEDLYALRCGPFVHAPSTSSI